MVRNITYHWGNEIQKQACEFIDTLWEKALILNLEVPESNNRCYTDIVFDLKSINTAGQACCKLNYFGETEYKIRLHPKALEHYGINYYNTIIHEVAHILVYINYPNSKPHGKEFKRIFTLLGGNGKRTHNYSLDSIMNKKRTSIKREFTYKCSCREIKLTKIRHNKVKRGVKYTCTYCNTPLMEVK